MYELIKTLVAVCSALTLASNAEARLYEPQKIVFIADDETSVCGLRADYTLSGATLRVEVLAAKASAGGAISARVYQPNSAGPLLRDVWIKTESLFTLGRFDPATMNSNGILEARGKLSSEEGKKFRRELTRGEVEISVIFDGVMPTARLPVGLPSPLPLRVRDQLRQCLRS